MRGRVRRSDEQAYCFLVSDSNVTTAIERLKLVAEVTDGFVLAEEDLLMRGPGDFFGEKQTGNVMFKWPTWSWTRTFSRKPTPSPIV